MLFFYKAKVRFRNWLQFDLWHRAKNFRFPPITPFTFCLWLALASDLAAPGYLVFHLGFTRLDVQAISQAATVTTAPARDTGAE